MNFSYLLENVYNHKLVNYQQWVFIHVKQHDSIIKIETTIGLCIHSLQNKLGF